MAKTALEQTAKEVEKYTFFNPKLRDASYATGDIYKKEDVAAAQQQWEISSEPGQRPYLAHIKSLSATWPHLRLLADFMEVSTSPIRWNGFLTGKRTEDERNERASRTCVTRLDYLASGKVVSLTCGTPIELENALKEGATEEADQREFRLFIVQDLSRDVIELLGGHLDIEPAFFRGQIFDYAWYNTRDRWVDPPQLNIVTRRQRWIQLRFATSRYFETASAFSEAREEAESFNVFRRPEDDLNNKAIWDEQGAIVGLSRTRASLWLSSLESNAKGVVGVLLIDPTIKEGVPLWYGYRNWEATPSMNRNEVSHPPPHDSLYGDLVYWAQKPGAFPPPPTGDPALKARIPILALLHLICSEWLSLSDYIRARLGQIEWEISFPEHFLDKGNKIDVALKKLHIWRRLVPLYREMLTEALHRMAHFQYYATGQASGSNGAGDTPRDDADNGNTAAQPQNSPRSLAHDAPPRQSVTSEMRSDFARVLAHMEEYQKRIDRLTSVVTAIISIEDSRRGLEDSRRGREDNRNVARLTWLATFFIPLSFIAGLFSMQADVTQLQDTIKWYFAAALPLAALSLSVALILGLPSVQAFDGNVLRKLKLKSKMERTDSS